MPSRLTELLAGKEVLTVMFPVEPITTSMNAELLLVQANGRLIEGRYPAGKAFAPETMMPPAPAVFVMIPRR